MTDNTGSTTNLYDAAGRLYGINYPSGASVRYGFDVLGRVTSLTNKASATGTAYVTRYGYDATGNITNVIDPFNGVTSLEYDRVGRRTKRMLPNNVVTEWQYDWRDRVTNIMHKKLDGTVLASFGYVRNAGGEPNRITREDGTYVLLSYDAALRLTNEVYYSSGGTPQTTNSYGYDASGSRVRWVNGGPALTNGVGGGYQIAEVKNGASIIDQFAYDAGGRVTLLSNAVRNLKVTYNAADQVASVTNGAAWVAYQHDANGRRTISTNYNGTTTVRRFLVAGTPGTDLQSPLLIANASGAVQAGYVFLGDDPVLRYDSAGNATYYLEDAMGSIAALADGGGNRAASFNYDGFGNVRSATGATNAPAGTGGDFRFHGAWLEEVSGFYNMRAREYDARMGRFTSADPLKGTIELAEEFHPFAYANNNPYVLTDPSGLSPSTEQASVGFIQTLLNTLRIGSAHQLRKKVYKEVSDILVGWAKDSISSYLLGKLPINLGTQFGDKVRKVFCFGSSDEDGAPNISGYAHFEVPVDEFGEPLGPGLSCREVDSETGKASDPGAEKRGIDGRKLRNGALIDMVISGERPVSGKNGKVGTVAKTWVTMEVKYSTKTVVNDYFRPGNKKKNQLTAMFRYTRKHTYSHTGVILVAQYTNKMNRKTFPQYERRIKSIAAAHHCVTDVVIMTDILKKKKKR